jgi:excisionase family DNA binding protein
MAAPELNIDPRQFVSRIRAAELLDCSPQTIDSLIKQSKLPAYHLGRKVLVKWSDVMALLGATQ